MHMPLNNNHLNIYINISYKLWKRRGRSRGAGQGEIPGRKVGENLEKIPGRTSGEPGGKSQGEPRDFRLRPRLFHCRLLPLLP